MAHQNLLNGPDPTYLPSDEEAREFLKAGASATEAAAKFPQVSYPWALLAKDALAAGESVQAYAYARTGYHRGLDGLRKSGWRGQGPIPAGHEPNQGFLLALLLLAEAAETIGESDEAERCRMFAADSDPAAADLLS